jgi:hypothetical protein
MVFAIPFKKKIEKSFDKMHKNFEIEKKGMMTIVNS